MLNYLALLLKLLEEYRMFFLQYQIVGVKFLDHTTHELETVGEGLYFVEVLFLLEFALFVLLF